MPRTSRDRTATATSRTPASPRLPAAPAEPEEGWDGWADEGQLNGLALRGLDLSGREVRSVAVTGCRFTDTALAAGRLEQAVFTDCVLDHCDLANLRAHDSSLARATVTASRLTGLAWASSLLRDVAVEGCRADLAGFRFARLRTVVIRDCTLAQADFQGADLRDTRFERCVLAGAQFSGATLKDTRFVDCDLSGVGGAASLAGATIQGGDHLGLLRTLAAALGITVEP
jgi:uncharacterized protein YjbI with pentapeptide repeats